MMMIPRRGDFDIFDEIFRDPFFTKNETKLMKTDIKETEDDYIIDIDLPGYEKENIKIEVTDGYLTVNAKTNTKNDEKNEKFVRKERYFGECSRSFYVGDNVETEDIKATYKNGTLTVTVPKKEETKEIPEKKYVQIED